MSGVQRRDGRGFGALGGAVLMAASLVASAQEVISPIHAAPPRAVDSGRCVTPEEVAGVLGGRGLYAIFRLEAAQASMVAEQYARAVIGAVDGGLVAARPDLPLARVELFRGGCRVDEFVVRREQLSAVLLAKAL